MNSFSPIVLFVYNRPVHTRQVLDSLAANPEARESILYIYCDGAKEGTTGDALNRIEEVRQLVRRENRFQKVIVTEQTRNKGLADSIMDGVTEVVNRHGKVIVLEDDLITSKGFLRYMNDALTMYESEKKVMHVSAYMFPVKEKLPDTFFYRQASCWGWGTWADRWKNLEKDAVKLFKELENTGKINVADIDGTNQFIRQLRANIDGSLKSWAVLWHFSIFLNDGLCLHPGKSLVRNIGMDSSGTNCDETDRFHVELTDRVNVSRVPIRDYKKVYRYLRNFYHGTVETKISLKTLAKDIIRPFIPKKLRDKIKLATDQDYRLQKEEEARINNWPRYTETEITFLNKRIKIADIASFQFMEKEIFGKEVYKFNSASSEPYIIDCGANIGLSVIYFKKLFPKSKVITFEPDHKIFRILKHNMESFGLSDVELVNKACWNKETTLEFYSEGADGGRAAKDFDTSDIIKVETVRLRDFINKPVAFLKMDIEGAENEVIHDIEDLLKNVTNIFIEFHSFVGKEQRLPEILTILKKAGFRLHISAPGLTSVNPFIQLRTFLNMDNQLNIYGIRENNS